MEFLKRAFDEQLTATVDRGVVVKVDGLTLTPAEILKSDQEAYDEEFLRWRNESWLPDQEFWLKETLNLYGNRKRYADLCTAFENGHVVP